MFNLLFFCPTEPDIMPECALNYTKTDGSLVCSFVFEGRYDWATASANCAQFGARLPKIESSADNEHLMQVKVTISGLLVLVLRSLRIN